MLHQWATLGEYDFVNIVEAPDAATVAKISLALGARGSAKLQSLELVDIDTLLRSARRLDRARCCCRKRWTAFDFFAAFGSLGGGGGSCASSQRAASSSGSAPTCTLTLGSLECAAARDRPLAAHRNPARRTRAEAGSAAVRASGRRRCHSFGATSFGASAVEERGQMLDLAAARPELELAAAVERDPARSRSGRRSRRAAGRSRSATASS